MIRSSSYPVAPQKDFQPYSPPQSTCLPRLRLLHPPLPIPTNISHVVIIKANRNIAYLTMVGSLLVRRPLARHLGEYKESLSGSGGRRSVKRNESTTYGEERTQARAENGEEEAWKGKFVPPRPGA